MAQNVMDVLTMHVDTNVPVIMKKDRGLAFEPVLFDVFSTLVEKSQFI